MTKVYVGASALKEMESKKLQFEENANSDYGVVYFIENGKLMGTNKSNGKTQERQPELDFYTTQRFVEFCEFKKGSIVVVIDETYSNSIPVGTIGKITDDHVAIDNTLRVNFTDIHGVERSAWFFPRRLRMASNEETKVFESAQRAKEFAEGKYARVTANDETRRMYGAHVFETGEIIKLVERYDSTGYRGESVKRSTKSSIRIEDMEIVEETVALTEMAKNATTGDIVYITKDNGNSYTSVGDIVKVTGTKYNDTAVNIEKADGSKAGFKYKENVRMATEAEKEKFEKAVEDVRLTIKEGDFARVIKNDSFQIGDVVKVGEFDGMHFEAHPVDGGEWRYIDERGEVEKITEEEYNKAKEEFEAKYAKDNVMRKDIVVVLESGNRRNKVGRVRTRCIGHVHLNDVDGNNMGASVQDGKYRLATDGEKAEFATKEAEFEIKRKEEAQWVKLGRKVGELRDGDVVEFNQSTGGAGFGTGSLAEIYNVRHDSKHFSFNMIGDRTNRYSGSTSWVKRLIATKESRVDLTVTK